MAFGMNKFSKMNLCASALATIVFALVIAASVAPWYYYQQSNVVTSNQGSSGTIQLVSTTVNSSIVNYDLDGFKQVDEKTAQASIRGSTTTRFYSYDQRGSNAVRNIFRLVQAFTYIAVVMVFLLLAFLVVFFADRLRNKLIFAIGMNVTRFVVLFFGIAVVISEIVAFLGFLGITNAFQSERTICTDGPCQDFVSRIQSDYNNQPTAGETTSTIREWGATTGWYLTLANIPISVVLLIIVASNKFPMPIDSDATSGEAL
jgi:lipopolysaccharide export LptBFGC system permease protein LptF